VEDSEVEEEEVQEVLPEEEEVLPEVVEEGVVEVVVGEVSEEGVELEQELR
jgi:hypothetical protein